MLNLRSAVPTDAALIVDYIRELAEFEREPEKAIVTEADILRYAFSEQPLVKVIMAEWDGQPAGFALWFLNFSTWEGKPGIYLEDLFVRPAARGAGVGGALMAACAKLCIERNYGRFEWSVLDWNEPALKFYRSLGAVPMAEWTVQRLTGAPLAALAARA